MSLAQTLGPILPVDVLRAVFEHSALDGVVQMRTLLLTSRASYIWTSSFLYEVVELKSFIAIQRFEVCMRRHLIAQPGSNFFARTVKHLGIVIGLEQVFQRLRHAIQLELVNCLKQVERRVTTIIAQCTGLQSFFSSLCIRWGPWEPKCMIVPPWSQFLDGLATPVIHSPSRAATHVFLVGGNTWSTTRSGCYSDWTINDHSHWHNVTHLAVEMRHVIVYDLRAIVQRESFKQLVLVVQVLVRELSPSPPSLRSFRGLEPWSAEHKSKVHVFQMTRFIGVPQYEEWRHGVWKQVIADGGLDKPLSPIFSQATRISSDHIIFSGTT